PVVPHTFLLSLPARLVPFPYTTLFRSGDNGDHVKRLAPFHSANSSTNGHEWPSRLAAFNAIHQLGHMLNRGLRHDAVAQIENMRDRKSTRLNSSHVKISYAVFCIGKKK